MLRAVLIDDEILAINLVENLLLQIGNVDIVGKFTRPLEGITLIERLRPDLLILDIEMPAINGLEVAEQILQIDDNIEIIFVTAYHHYALEAFRVHAVDYLLKPVDPERLHQALLHVEKRHGKTRPVIEAPNSLQVQFLGDFQVFDSQGVALKWRTKKVKELCAYLLHHQAPVHKNQIIEDLWPGTPLDKAAVHLHTSIYKLRKMLKQQGFDSPIQYKDERYFLSLEVQSDLQDFMKAIAQVEQHDSNIIPLLAMYEQDYFDGEDYPWSLALKENLRQAFKRVAEKVLANQLNSLGAKPIYVKDLLEKLITLEPLEERYPQELIKYYLQQGNERKALEVYYNLREILLRELGDQPQQETEALIHQYLK